MCSPKQSIGAPTLRAEIEAMKTQHERETRTYAAQHHDAVKNAQRWAQGQERQQLAKAGQRFAHRHRHTTGANPALRGRLPGGVAWPWDEVVKNDG